MRMHEALTKFIEFKTLGRRQDTIRGYYQDIRILCLTLGNPDLSQVTIENIIGVINSMLVLGWDENSFVHKSSAYRKFFEFCKLMKWCSLDPELIPIPRQQYRIPRVAKEDDYRKLLDVIPIETSDPRHIRNRLFLNLLWETGARLSELLMLNVSGLDIQRKKAVIHTEKSRGKRPFREIMWREESAGSMERWLEKRDTLQDSKPFTDVDALFVSVTGMKYGQRLMKSGAGECVRRYCDKAGIPYMNPHSFRHAFCHDIIKKGGSSADVMNLAGHSTIASSTPYLAMFGDELEKRYRIIKGN